MCRRLCLGRQKSQDERTLEMGKKRIKRDLDIRNLIKAQDLLKTFIKLKVTKREKRKLLRLQRSNVILEPDSDFSQSNSEDDVKQFSQAYHLFKEEFEDLVEDDLQDTMD